MIIKNISKYRKMFEHKISMSEPDGRWIFSIGKRETQRVFDLTPIGEKRLNSLINESIETGDDKVYNAVKGYELEIPKNNSDVIY